MITSAVKDANEINTGKDSVSAPNVCYSFKVSVYMLGAGAWG